MSSQKKPLADRTDFVQEAFRATNFNPFERMMNQSIRAATRNISLSGQCKMDIDCEKLEFAVNSELCKYVAPQLKAVELTGEVDVNNSVSVSLTIGNKAAVKAFLGEPDEPESTTTNG